MPGVSLSNEFERERISLEVTDQQPTDPPDSWDPEAHDDGDARDGIEVCP